MHSETQSLRNSLWPPIVFVLLLWIVKIIETLGGFDFSDFGVYPRSLSGLIGIITAPFLHGDWEHLFSNSVPLIALGFLVIQLYRSVAMPVLLFIYVMSGVGMWLFGRPSHHIGASGLVYGLAFFLFVSGVLRKDRRSMASAAIVAVFYGGMVWGMLPGLRGISWEGHVAGALAGMAMAYRYRYVNLPEPYEWESEPDYYNEGEIWEEPFWVLPPEPDWPTSDNNDAPISDSGLLNILPPEQQTPTDNLPPVGSQEAQKPPPEQIPLEIRYYYKPKD